jgi:hypothetical protein
VTQQQSVSSPIATGGGGNFFEQHVDALFLALLLVRGIPPIMLDCQIEEVHLQTAGDRCIPQKNATLNVYQCFI